MPTQTDLEQNGTLHDHPLAELLLEIRQANLNGSLRTSSAEHKTIVYFDAGEVVFAVSNARHHRLFSILLREKKVPPAELAKVENPLNDFELGKALIERGLLSKKELAESFSAQIEGILQSGFAWQEGRWNFSPLIRANGSARFPVGLAGMLALYARSAPAAAVSKRFNSFQELFAATGAAFAQVDLQPAEAFVLSRLDAQPMTVEEIIGSSGLSETEVLKSLYVLWLGGFIKRLKWNQAFSPEQIRAMRSAALELKRAAAPVFEQAEAARVKPKTPEIPKQKEQVRESVSLDEYLERVENAATLYEVLDVSPNASNAGIKSSYLFWAKHFHPDLFRRQVEADLHRRVQDAFTKIAHAYETLKDEEQREVYDYKHGKELAHRKSRQNTSAAHENMSAIERQAAETFDQGFGYLMEEDYEQAIPLLARAAHLAGGNARYHAVYAKALAADQNTYRQAEAELQAALRIEPENAEYRLMLVDLYIKIGLLKRAEGELSRLLQKAPDNAEARAMLDRLRNK